MKAMSPSLHLQDEQAHTLRELAQSTGMPAEQILEEAILMLFHQEFPEAPTVLKQDAQGEPHLPRKDLEENQQLRNSGP